MGIGHAFKKKMGTHKVAPAEKTVSKEFDEAYVQYKLVYIHTYQYKYTCTNIYFINVLKDTFIDMHTNTYANM